MRFLLNTTIWAKLMILSGILLLALAGTSLLQASTILDMQQGMTSIKESVAGISQNAADVKSLMEKQQTALNQQEAVNVTLRSFGELKYWLADLSASWLNNSEANAVRAKDELLGHLKTLVIFAPEEAASVQTHIEKLYALSNQAVDAYADSNRVLGNSLLSDSRQEALEADKILISLSEAQKAVIQGATSKTSESSNTTAVRGAAAVSKAEETIKGGHARMSAVNITLAVVMVLALALSALITRSLIKPIRELVKSMSELAKGNLDVTLPPLTDNEIGEMIRAVEVFKSNAKEHARIALLNEMERERGRRSLSDVRRQVNIDTSNKK